MNPRRKAFRIAGQQIRQIIPDMGSCLASDRITVDGMKVGYMYREQPDNEIDSGWRFFSGEEDQDFADNPDNFALFSVNTICNYDSAIIPCLNAAPGAAFGRVPGSDKFEAEELQKSDVE